MKNCWNINKSLRRNRIDFWRARRTKNSP